MTNSKLIEVLQQSINKEDPTQKLIGLLAVLVDNKFNSLNETIADIKEDIFNQDVKIDNLDHSKSCPFGVPAKIQAMEKAIEPVIFVDKYPKLAVLMLLGILSLLGLGFDKLTDIVKTFIK